MGLDLDGTLLNVEHRIPVRTQEAVAAARARGIKVVIVTGRMYQSARPYAQQLGLAGLPVGTYNGAAIWDFPSGKLLSHEPMPLEACKRLAAFCEAKGLHLNAYMDDELYVPSMSERTRDYVAVAGVEAHPVGSVFLWLTRPSTKMLIVAEPDEIQGIKPEVLELMGPTFNVVQSHPKFLEVTGERATKGHALAWIANSLGIPRESVMAVGDAGNDMAMFRWAGTSFAMEHSMDEVKRAANYVAKGGPGIGVVDALERMGLV